MTFKKNDFIEIEFTARVKNGDVFDSNIKEEVEKLHQGHDHKIDAKPLIFSLGNGMFLKSIEEFLIGKELGIYEVDLSPEKAFGLRNKDMIKTVPMKFFKENKLNPFLGAVFNFDNFVGKVISVSGGRVLVDFNHPLANKEVVYKVNVLKKIENTEEKVKALCDFFFRKNFEFEVKDKKIILEADKNYSKFITLFKEKFKEILDLDLEVKEVEEENEKQENVDNKNL